ncbi:MAG: molecular chaperone [Burkholderiaceae bacterium]|jgi:fimbrial chaperone protein|nr:molecular chaperone [Burkholderiaceae bacterium]
MSKQRIMQTSLSRVWGVSFALATMLPVLSPSSIAAGLQVTPITLQIPINRQAEGIWLINTGQEPLSAQVRAFQWTQKNSEDLLAPTNNLTISPPLIEIPPGGRQLVRVLRTGSPPAVGTEASYRLIVDELPTETKEQNQADANVHRKSGHAYGMKFLMRYSVPVFIGDATEESIRSVNKDLHWSITRERESWALEVSNAGSIHAQLADVAAVGAEGQTMLINKGMLGYVLPGSTMRWTVPTPQISFPVKAYQAMINSDVQPINVPASP